VSDNLHTFGLNSDFVAALAAKGVRTIVVGGLAVHNYCAEREADDLDLLVEPTASAGAAIVDVLFRFNDAAGFRPGDFARPGQHYRQKRALYLDLLTPHEEDNFDAIWERGTSALLNGIPVRVAATSDLLRMKRRAFAERGDDKDLRDIELLEATVV
jgi:hypothetical protein